MPSVYEVMGGAPACRALADALTARCLLDPELSHAFDHGMRDDHDERLGAYFGEVFGGPPLYTAEHGGDQTSMVRLHSGEGIGADWEQRFLTCFDAACDDAALPADPRLRSVLHDYMAWAVVDTNRYPDDRDAVPAGLPMPHWGWDGRPPGPVSAGP